MQLLEDYIKNNPDMKLVFHHMIDIYEGNICAKYIGKYGVGQYIAVYAEFNGPQDYQNIIRAGDIKSIKKVKHIQYDLFERFISNMEWMLNNDDKIDAKYEIEQRMSNDNYKCRLRATYGDICDFYCKVGNTEVRVEVDRKNSDNIEDVMSSIELLKISESKVTLLY